MKQKTEIERLIAESYSGVRPSDAVEDAVRDGLPGGRLAPRRFPPLPALVSAAAVLALVVALAFAWGARGGAAPGTGDGLADGGGALTLPVVARPGIGVVPRSNDELTVHLATGGRLLVLSHRNAWEQVSLDGFAAHLRANAGRKGCVVVRADRGTPWRWLQWLMMVCAEQKRVEIALAVQTLEGREYRLDATLPVDLGIGVPRSEIMVSVTVRPDGDRARYSFGDTESVELASVARWIAGAKKAAAASSYVLVGELKAAGTTPWEHAARLLGEFRQGGVDPVRFYGTALPTREQRAARTLPAPEGDWPGRRRSGVPGLDEEEEEIVEEEPILDSKPALIFDADTADAVALDRAAEIVHRRLDAAGLGNLIVVRDGRVLRVEQPADEARLPEVRQLVERRQGTLELHLTIEPDAPNYETYWLRLENALGRGAKFEDVRDVKPTDRALDDVRNGRYPLGLRWYELSENSGYRRDRPRVRYQLCRNDDCNVTQESLFEVSLAPSGGHCTVMFKVKPEHRENLARLTSELESHLAIILNGRVHSTPRVLTELREAVQITGGYTEAEARALAALLASEPLPVKFTLVAAEGR